MEPINITQQLEQQYDLEDDIITLYENFKKEPTANRTKPFLTIKLRQLQYIHHKFDTNHDVIILNTPFNQRKDINYFKEGIYKKVQDISFKMQLRIEEWKEKIMQTENEQQLVLQQQTLQHSVINNATAATTTAISQRTNEVRLPRVNIEQFSGDYRRWTSFKNLFKTLIHDKNDIPAIEKFYYLKSHIVGEANKLINHYTITEQNYAAAWKTLETRYDNKRILINMELKALLEQPAMTSETSTQIRKLLDTTTECLNSLNNLDVDTSTWNSVLIFILSQKLNSETTYHWENSLPQPKEVPTITQFLTFLEARFNALEHVNNSKPQYGNNSVRNRSQNWQPNNRYENNRTSTSHQRAHTTTSNEHRSSFLTAATSECLICSGDHPFFKCEDFVQASPGERRRITTHYKQCLNCLHNHHERTCLSVSRCRKCNERHHTMLHMDVEGNSNSEGTLANSSNRSNPFANNPVHTNPSTSNHFAKQTPAQQEVLLATALVKVIVNQHKYTLRCLIDQGSQSTFITENAAQLLNLKRIPVTASVTGLGAAASATIKNLIKVKINSIYDSNYSLAIDAFVLPKITGLLPSSTVTATDCSHFWKLELADPDYYRPNKIDMLLGADVYASIICSGLRKGMANAPIAQRTRLGWILSGNVHAKQSCMSVSFHQRIDLEHQLKSFWEQEEVYSSKVLSADEIKCEQIFTDTHYRDITGRYTVALPFKSSERKPLGKSRYRALSRLEQLEKKLAKDAALRHQYKEVMNEYVRLGHMIPAEAGPSENEVYYLPHHCVVKESSSTTKVRVVFDASAKTTTGESLNEQLLVGPTIQQELPAILLRWRRHQIVLAADIEKMYRQINVQEKDTNFQRILWRDHPSEKVSDFKLTTVTFGNASAPFLATRVLQQLAYDEASKYPTAVNIVLKDFYVDDLLTGVDNESDAIQLQMDITKLLGKGGFQLRQWLSNCQSVIDRIPVDARQTTLPLNIKIDQTTKTLGIHYHPHFDTFQFKIHLEAVGVPPTKRILLSETARLFDPMGWLGPVIIKAKIFFQELWKKEMTWDQQLDRELSNKWIRFRNELQSLEDIRITRWLQTTKHSTIQLHGFSDASESAYAAVVYARVTNPDRSVQMSMITSKTRVAPIKLISLPRLELCAAVLLKRLLEKTKTALEMTNEEMYAYTDSKVVLAWISSNPAKWKSYVAHRVTEIQNSAEKISWNYVSTKENPADCASRGIYPSELKSHLLWWEGPTFLRNTTVSPVITSEPFTTNAEIKQTGVVSMMQISNDEQEMLHKYSSWGKLVRIIATCLRFGHNCKFPTAKRLGSLGVAEIRSAEYRCINIVQKYTYPQEYNCLMDGQQLNKKSSLLSLNPFIGQEGSIRVGGRLQNSDLSFNQKHPVIVPSHGHVTRLIINDAHIRTQHGGIQLTMTLLRKRFWVIQSRNAVKRCINDCVNCFKYKKRTSDQLMGSLPSQRLQVTRPFSNVGIDYAGPMTLKASMLRSTKTMKGYIALFVCFSTKAVHIELVSDLSTQAFLAAFNRFVARRGLPVNVHSDNGTNFVGADNEFKKIFKRIISDESIGTSLAETHVQWHFIPPRSPHFGGLWEAGVKSIKGHLYRTLGNAFLTFEEMSTILAQIEASLNSRPLQPLTEDVNDFSALTPGHFLIGSELLAPPQENLLEDQTNRLQKWRRLSQIQQQFWKRWSNEYLSTLQQRFKWKVAKNELAIGNMVLLKEDNMPPNKWKLCRIMELHPGKDKHIRVVTIRTPHGVTKRPITKICLLPNQQEE